MKKIVTHTVALNGQTHTLMLTGPVLNAERTNLDLTVWAEQCEDTPSRVVDVCAYRHGDVIPAHAQHLATSSGPEGFVWHLYDVTPPTDDDTPDTTTEES
ncbi:hypothetical protein [uncultured Aeromicrobium sp.]|uniref:DUF7352 domain-containing protein n=1 Tax=uncultured Aeromicrobium sp. TaxID=337820 RepID=UPI0025D40E4E|nr:hypothetical protein [uncultured Aeromicrobium sp.]